MKKITLILGTLAIGLGSLQAQQVNRKPLVEHFTQASCGPCATQNPTLYNTLNNFGSGNYVKITYQTSWPGVDPMNAQYPAGPDVRRRLYGITGVPNAVLNGGNAAGPNAAVTATTLSNAASLMSDFEIRPSHRYLTGRDIEVTVIVKNVGSTTQAAGKLLHSAMTEEDVTYATAPGSNGETEFFYVVRNMYNASTGASSTAGHALPAINAGDSVSYTFTVDAPGYIRTYDEIGFAFFIQDPSTDEVFQSEYSAPVPLPTRYDVSTTNGAFGNAAPGYCTPAFTPSFDVTNTETTTITDIEAQYSIDGGAPVPVSVTGLSLAQNQNTTISFPGITLAQGTNNIEYSIVSLNGGNPDYTTANNNGLIGIAIIASPTSVDTDISSDFQGLPVGGGAPANSIAVNPDRVRAYKVDNTITSAVNWNLGGFGNSNGCYRWDFWAIPNGSTASILYEKIDMTANTNIIGATLKWASAFAHYNNLPDRLRVKVSTDCGATWTTLYDKAGSTLANAGVNASSRFYPRVNQWVWDSVSLDSYITATELMVEFEGVSGFGNSLYIDDINIEFQRPVNVQQVAAPVAQLEIFPNPANRVLNVTFETPDAEELTLTVTNALGQTIQQVASGTFRGEQTIQVNTSAFATGIYFINAVSNTGVTTKRFVVER